MTDKPGKTRRTMTVIWSVGIAIALIVFTTSVMLPSTKRTRIDFRSEPRLSRVPAMKIPGTLPTTTPATLPAGPEFPSHLYGSKSGVFDLAPATTQPDNP
mgnify:CR=1 FL=1